MYPIVSNWYGEYTAHTEIKTYDEQIQKIGNEAIERIFKEAQAYNTALAKHENEKISATDYNSLLAVSDSIGYIEIPKIKVYLPIFHGMDDDVLQRGIGHMEGSSLPVGGDSSHCVLAGHTGLPSANLFTDLDQLVTGDMFYIHTLDKVLTYKVDQIMTVLPYETQYTEIEPARDYVTLVTCTPYGINSHRLLVRGKRVANLTQDMEHTNPWPVVHTEEQKVPFRTIVWYASLIIVTAVIIIILIILFLPALRSRKTYKKRSSEEEKEE